MNVGALGRPRRGLGFIVVMAVVLSLGAGIARAGGEDEKQARALYERAEKSFNVGKFAEALTDYQAAYEAKPLPGFLFNIAQCYRNMGNYERARFFFRRYLSIEPKAPNHRKVEELIAEMSKQIDAQAAAAASAPVTAPPPATQLPLPSSGASGAGGETKPSDPPASAPPEPKPVEPLPAAPPPVETTSPSAAAVLTTTAPAPEETQPPLWKRWWFWTGVGAVVVGGAVAAFFLTRPKTVTPGTLSPIDGR